MEKPFPVPRLTAAGYMCRNSGKNARDETSQGLRPGGKENNMAGKNNAKPANKTEPAEGAAMAETTGGAAEQTVTPGREDEQAPGADRRNGVRPEHMDAFSLAVLESVASLIAGAGFTVRLNDELVAPSENELLAVSFRQGRGITAVTVDGRKFSLKDGAVNEA